ncbi:MAG: hypothetical protein SVY53_08840 [Chloroflexota bacterium]|nr:hypothetical protein [Chloroflexota bacterium]
MKRHVVVMFGGENLLVVNDWIVGLVMRLVGGNLRIIVQQLNLWYHHGTKIMQFLDYLRSLFDTDYQGTFVWVTAS